MRTQDKRIIFTIIAVVCVIIAVMYLFPLFIGFTALLIYYWPYTLIATGCCISLYKYIKWWFAVERKSYLYDSDEYRLKYELETSMKPMMSEMLTKSYKRWLIKKNTTPTSLIIKNFLERFKIMVVSILLLILMGVLTIYFYRAMQILGVFRTIGS